MKDYKLIMLSAGFEHGGNTTHRFLDSHPELAVYPTESMLGTPTAANLLTPAIPFRYAWPSFDSEMSPIQAYQSMYDEEVKTYLRTPDRSKFKHCGMQINEADRIALFEKYCEGKSGRKAFVEAYFRSTFDSWKNFNWTGKETHWVGYLPAVHLDAEKFFKDFPDGHMIYVSRNPFSAYADTKKRPFPWSLSKYCRIWNILQNHAFDCARLYPKQFHIVRYEDLISYPTNILPELCRKIGINPEVKNLVPSFNRIPLTNGQIYPWGTIKQATVEENVKTALELSTQEFVDVAMYTTESRIRFGYINEQ